MKEKGNPADYIKGLVPEPELPRDKIILPFFTVFNKAFEVKEENKLSRESEPEPTKKATAPQHCSRLYKGSVMKVKVQLQA